MHASAKRLPDLSAVESVFLDMDGTLLDLHFDNHFWLEHLPLRFGERHGMSAAASLELLTPRFRAVEGTLAWYSLDYWSRELDMDLVTLKREVEHLIKVLPHAEEFLEKVRALGKRLVLVTNAHEDVLNLKLERTRIESHFDRIVSSHDLGYPKETAEFWHSLQATEPFDPEKTLFADDSLPVLRAARDYGIRHIVAMRRPDSQRPARDIAEFSAIETFAELLPDEQD
ncbi:MAG TPA: GMP/IMP nucleotidase [Gammaproteobacteria bacterium]|jgi:putative hydrolase of the HAD superfamily|nr:GMP/IMP nucleotidase [Gammaproteobacteria bacterium]